MNEQKLKPCPFCGGEAIIIHEAFRKNIYGVDVIGTAIGCDNCNAQMFYRDKEEAIEAWNKRIGESDTQ